MESGSKKVKRRKVKKAKKVQKTKKLEGKESGEGGEAGEVESGMESVKIEGKKDVEFEEGEGK